MRLLKLPRHHPTLHCRQTFASRHTEQVHPNDSTENTPESKCGFRFNRETEKFLDKSEKFGK